jgi:hypothetical protein
VNLIYRNEKSVYKESNMVFKIIDNFNNRKPKKSIILNFGLSSCTTIIFDFRIGNPIIIHSANILFEAFYDPDLCPTEAISQQLQRQRVDSVPPQIWQNIWPQFLAPKRTSKSTKIFNLRWRRHFLTYFFFGF